QHAWQAAPPSRYTKSTAAANKPARNARAPRATAEPTNPASPTAHWSAHAQRAPAQFHRAESPPRHQESTTAARDSATREHSPARDSCAGGSAQRRRSDGKAGAAHQPTDQRNAAEDPEHPAR